jgi:Uma2 family endonuclease
VLLNFSPKFVKKSNNMTVLAESIKKRVPQQTLLTYEDYARLTPADSPNYELHKGKIITMPTPIPRHQLISSELHILLGSYVKINRLGKIIAAPMDTKFTEHDTVQPDLLFISTDRLHIIGEKKIEAAPDFIVEIKSPGNPPKEMIYKKKLYESCGVSEYWIIYPEKNTIEQYENQGNNFVQIGEFGLNDTINSFVIKDFQVKVREILE